MFGRLKTKSVPTVVIAFGLAFQSLACPAVAFTEVNLICKLRIDKSFNGKPEESVVIRSRYVITETAGSLYITPDSDNLFSVSINPDKKREEAKNYTDERKWHIINTFTDEISINKREIIIDRYAGTISTNSLTMIIGKSLSLSKTGFGNCNKIDVSKKKF